MMRKTAFIYPGQGAQHIGMGRDAAERYAASAKIFEEADAALGFGLTDLIFNGGEEELKITENTQPALLTVCVALTAPLVEAGIYPDAAAGLSIGEYAAHALAGTFAFEGAVKAVRTRGKLMQEATPPGVGGMAAIIGLGAEEAESCCREAAASPECAGLVVEPVNYNCPGQIVIAGHAKAVETACALCKKRGAKRALMLAVSAPFHSSLMSGAGEKFAAELAKLETGMMRIPVISNVTAEYVTCAEEAISLLARQAASPVKWEQGVRAMLAGGVGRFVEIGPGRTLAGFLKKIDESAEVINVSDAASVEAAIGLLNRADEIVKN